MKNFQLALAALCLLCFSQNTLSAAADYRINGVTGSASITSVSQTKNYVVTIHNIGTAATANSALRCYVSNNATWDAADLALPAWVQVGALAANASVIKTMSLTLPISVGPGAKYLIFRCDDFNQIAESNESNNTKNKAISVGIYLNCAPANHLVAGQGGSITNVMLTNKTSAGILSVTIQYNSGGSGWITGLIVTLQGGGIGHTRQVAANPLTSPRNATIKYQVTEAGKSAWYYVNVDQQGAAGLGGSESEDRAEEAETPAPAFEASVFPNPATDVLNIELPETAQAIDIQLIDATGKTLRRRSKILGETRLQIPVADLPAGVYFLKTQCGEAVSTKRVLKN